MVRHVAAAAGIPLRIEPAGIKSRGIDSLRRKVEIESQLARGLALAPGDREFVQIVGRPPRILVLAIVGGTVDIDHLSHRQDLLEAVEDERIALRAILALAYSEPLARVG